MAFEEKTRRIASLLSDTDTGTPEDIDYALRFKKKSTTRDVTAATGTLDVTVIASLERASFMVSGSFVPESGQVAGANSRDVQLFYDDGAGGAATAISVLFDGTASDMDADQNNALDFTGFTDDLVPATSRVFFRLTDNGTGFVMDETLLELEYKYQ